MSSDADPDNLKEKETLEFSTEHNQEMEKTNIPNEQQVSSPSPLLQQEPSFSDPCDGNTEKRPSDSLVEVDKLEFQEKQLSLGNSADVRPNYAGFQESGEHDHGLLDSSLTGSMKIDSIEDCNRRNFYSRVCDGREFYNGKAGGDAVSEVPLNGNKEVVNDIVQPIEGWKRGHFDSGVHEGGEFVTAKVGCHTVSEIHVNEKKGNGNNLLDIKKKQLLSDLQSGSFFGLNDKNNNHHGAVSAVSEKGLGKKQKKNGNDGIIDGSRGCPIKIEVVDETALIDSMPVPGIGNLNGRKNVKELRDGKKQKRGGSRKGRGGIKGADKLIQLSGFSGTGIKNGGDGTKRVYSREELEALRYVNVPGQRKLWGSIYGHLGPVVAQELSSLVEYKHRKRTASSGFNSRQQHYGRGVSQMPGILGGIAGTGRGDPLNVYVNTDLLRALYARNWSYVSPYPV